MKPVLVFTATGQVGRHVVSGLSLAGIPVLAATRDITRARDLFTAEILSTNAVDFIQIDMRDNDAVRDAADGCDQAYIASADSSDQVQVEVDAAKAALEAGATHIVKLSSCDAAPDAPFSWSRHHAAIEQQIASLTTEYSFLRPHYFMQNLFSFAKEIAETDAISVPADDGRIGMIDARDIAAVAVNLLVNHTPLRRTAELTGPEPVTFKRVAAAISQAINREVAFNVTTDDKYLRRLIDHDNMSPEHAEEIARLYRDVRDGLLDIQTNEVQAITGQQPRSVEQFAKDYSTMFNKS